VIVTAQILNRPDGIVRADNEGREEGMLRTYGGSRHCGAARIETDLDFSVGTENATARPA
jgi:hypothetical protein